MPLALRDKRSSVAGLVAHDRVGDDPRVSIPTPAIVAEERFPPARYGVRTFEINDSASRGEGRIARRPPAPAPSASGRWVGSLSPGSVA